MKRGLISFVNDLILQETKKTMQDEQIEKMTQILLHGQWLKQRHDIPTVKMNQSNVWLQNLGLKFEIESIICTAQEQALITNHVQAKLWKMVPPEIVDYARRRKNYQPHHLRMKDSGGNEIPIPSQPYCNVPSLVHFAGLWSICSHVMAKTQTCGFYEKGRNKVDVGYDNCNRYPSTSKYV